jgi:hypothetical protein
LLETVNLIASVFKWQLWGEITMFNEIYAIINKLESDKSPISDNMPRELIKNAGGALKL